MDNTLQFISDYVRHEKIAMLEEIIGKIQHNIDLDDIQILEDYLSKLKGEENESERKNE